MEKNNINSKSSNNSSVKIENIINIKNNSTKFNTIFANKPLQIELNKTSKLSNGSCWVKCGNTVVMANVTMSSNPREGVNFFPLSVDYEEKLYAVGKIPGSFLKREGKPTNHAILVSRCIDRAIRPFFPKDMRNDVCVVATVLASDIDNSPEVCAMLAVSIALFISNVPWNGPVLGINVGLINNTLVLNPNSVERKNSRLSLTVAASSEKIAMIEAGACEVVESTLIEAIKLAHQEIKKLICFIEQNLSAFKKTKLNYFKHTLPENILSEIETNHFNEIKNALLEKNKIDREQKLNTISETLKQKIATESEEKPELISECLEYLEKKIVRSLIFDNNIRVDGRKLDEIRPLSCEVNLLPQVHGSAVFSRGLTQTMSVVTLGGPLEEQKLDGLDEQTSKRYMHHYNFPSYSVGETKANRGPGRREIGHGALAERALQPVIPDNQTFPYTIRVVSETLSSNGSTSQASICSSTLALMDAGVPIKNPVAGISCGLVTKNKDFKTFLDIQGIEDFFGDMDFKVSGTKEGITAIQVDVKIDGLTMEIIEEVFEKTKQARIKIIDEVFKPIIDKPNSSVKKSAPKIITLKIPEDKIKNVIGTYGKTVQKIVSDFDVKVDIQEDGTIFILGKDETKTLEAKSFIEKLTTPPKIGEVYRGVVKRIVDFGAFVEILPNQEGLVHISKLANRRIKEVSDVVNIGDEIKVKVVEIDSQGKINLSKKDVY